MTTDIHDKAAVEHKLWAEIAETRFGMLGAARAEGAHFAPMTTFAEPETGSLWFYTQTDNSLAEAAQAGATGLYVFMSKDRKLQASIRGRLTASTDPLHRDKFWSPVVSAYFPKGKSDPHLIMLRLACEDTEVWLSDSSVVKFAFEIAKANLTGAAPDLGGKAALNLA
jgi:general stress protein 26